MKTMGMAARCITNDMKKEGSKDHTPHPTPLNDGGRTQATHLAQNAYSLLAVPLDQ